MGFLEGAEPEPELEACEEEEAPRLVDMAGYGQQRLGGD